VDHAASLAGIADPGMATARRVTMALDRR